MAKHKHQDVGHARETLRGVIRDFNFSPKGGIEGLLLDLDGATVQVNVPIEAGLIVAQAVGESVEATVEPEPETHEWGEHPVYRLVALKADDGRTLALGGPGQGESVKVDGVVKRLNYAKHGEANGVVLEDGDFVHLKPHGMQHVGLRVGQRVKVEGKAGPSPFGRRVIEASVVNGVEIGPKGPKH